MWEASLTGLMSILRPELLAIMMIGVIPGTIVSVLPSIGSTAMLTMALPFAMVMSPYGAIALIELGEGLMFGSNIVGCDPSEVKIGMPVEVVFNDVAEGIVLPRFRPVR